MINKHKTGMITRTANHLKSQIGKRPLVLVGLMGAGKSTIGKRIARILGLRFCDSDHEIETVSQMTIPELFAIYGEQEFRNLERRVIFRLLNEGPLVIATGGGAFMNFEIRRAIRERGLSVWLSADIDVLLERVSRKNNRPLLRTGNPRDIMKKLMYERYPVYAEADITMQSRNIGHNILARNIIRTVDCYLTAQREFVLNED